MKKELIITHTTADQKIKLAVGDELTIVADRGEWTGVYFDIMSIKAAKGILKAKRETTRATKLAKVFTATKPGGPTKLAAVFEIMPDAELTVAERLGGAKSTIVVVEVTVAA